MGNEKKKKKKNTEMEEKATTRTKIHTYFNKFHTAWLSDVAPCQNSECMRGEDALHSFSYSRLCVCGLFKWCHITCLKPK